MKKLTSFLSKIRDWTDKEFWMYTGLFFVMMMAIYAYVIFAVGTDAPKFTYAEF